MNKVTVASHPETGNIITPSTKNPEYGTIRVDSVETTFKNGFMNKSKRSAFIRGEIVNLESLNLKEGSQMNGKIIKTESFEPFFEDQECKINPTTGEVVLTNGRETFLQFEFTTDVNASDTFLPEPELVVAGTEEEAKSETGQAI